MYDIYSNAYITIAADAAKDPQAGFLEGNRQTALNTTTELRVRRGKDLESVVFIRPRSRTDDLEYFRCHHNDKVSESRSHLHMRGWILQESLLSPHIVHFAPQEIAWQCASGFLCECERWSIKGSQVKEPFAGDNWQKLRLENIHTDWNGVVQAFTDRGLTKVGDRLFAMAGLAQRAQTSRPGVRYHAGMWEDDIRRSLLWIAAEYSSPHTRVKPQIAPSWSWGGVTGRVNYNRAVEATDLEDVVIDNPYTEQYGSMAGLKLTATSHLFRIRAIKSQILPARKRAETGTCRLLTFEVALPKRKDTRSHTGILWSDTIEDSKALEIEKELTILNCRAFETFLALAKLDDSDLSFRRVGFLTCSHLHLRGSNLLRGRIEHNGSSVPQEFGIKKRIHLF